EATRWIRVGIVILGDGLLGQAIRYTRWVRPVKIVEVGPKNIRAGRRIAFQLPNLCDAALTVVFGIRIMPTIFQLFFILRQAQTAGYVIFKFDNSAVRRLLPDNLAECVVSVLGFLCM